MKELDKGVNKVLGNKITANALNADDGAALIGKALDYIKQKYEWRPVDTSPLFSGVYYDDTKVGSYIIKVKNEKQETAVLKIQLRPLQFDEGFIIRHVSQQNKSEIIKLPRILNDEAWNENVGFGYLIFEDLSHLPNLWKGKVTDHEDRLQHAKFLSEFMENVLPIDPWFVAPDKNINDLHKDAFVHFEEIASKSNFSHVDKVIIKKNKEVYFKVLDNFNLGRLHFTHGHISGDDVKYDPKNCRFYLMANPYWSYRPSHYELTFPMWVDIMHIRDENLTFEIVRQRIEDWNDCWRQQFGENNIDMEQLCFNMLERAVTTIMLDLGASNWLVHEKVELQKLLEVWQEIFDWIIKEKFSKYI